MNILFFFAGTFSTLAASMLSWRLARKWSDSPNGRARY